MPKTDFWSKRRVLLTGHTGFKGAWTAALLAELGADVTAIALPPEGEPNLWKMFDGRVPVTSVISDIRDAGGLSEACAAAQPEIVLHMAAQAQVRRGYLDPVATYATNVMGTINLLQALRPLQTLKAVLIVTSDKVYANQSGAKPFREDDPLGGSDPYSASKAATELAVRSYVESYFSPRGIAVATARAGNVLGGGDFSSDRLVPDVFRSARSGEPVVLRYPQAQRSWFHVLDCVAGYLRYIRHIHGKPAADPPALNFGPSTAMTVAEVADIVGHGLGSSKPWRQGPVGDLPEKMSLKLDCSLATRALGWSPRLTMMDTMSWTAEWYAAFAEGAVPLDLVTAQIKRYLQGAT